MKKILFIFVFVLIASGCASLQSAPIDIISKLPVVRVGDTPPTNQEYIVYYPSGNALPIKLKTSGSLFTENKEVVSRVTLSKDLYLYKYWASHDKKIWKYSHELLRVQFGGGFDITGIHVSVELEGK